MTLEESKNLYLEAQKHLAKNTIRQQRFALGHFIKFLRTQDIHAVQDIAKETVLTYQTNLSRSGKSVVTVIAILVILKSFFRWLLGEGCLFYDPGSVITIPKKTHNISDKVLTQAEVTRFLSIPNVKTPKGLRDRALFEVLYSSALRNEELINLDLYDVNEKDGTIFIRQGKGSKDRVVPIGKVALEWLRKYLEEVRRYYAKADELALFVTLWGDRIKQKSLIYMIHTYVTQSGIQKRITPHVFRHTCATHMLQGGADIRYVQEMLGHTSAHTTEIYTHLDIRDLKEMTSKAHRRKTEPVKAEVTKFYHYKLRKPRPKKHRSPEEGGPPEDTI